MGKYSHMTNEEFRVLIKGTKAVQFTGESTSHVLSGEAPAESKDWRDVDGVVTPVKDQGSCGSCWAFSAAETLESHLAIATGKAVPKLSPQQIVDCAPNPDHCGGTGGCDGSTQPLAFNYTQAVGITTESEWPYQKRFPAVSCETVLPYAGHTGYVELPTNSNSALMQAV